MSLITDLKPLDHQDHKELKLAYFVIFTMFVALLAVHIAIGYGIAPIIFRHFDKKLAGEIMGHIFDSYHSFYAYCLTVLVFVSKYSLAKLKKIVPVSKLILMMKRIFFISGGLFILTAVQIFLQFQMQILKVQTPTLISLSLGVPFGILHAISQVIYLGQTILMAWVVWLFYKKNQTSLFEG